MMINYPDYPLVQATKDNKLVLREAYQVKHVTIPAGFESDGLTLKLRVFRLVVARYSPRFMPFFFVKYCLRLSVHGAQGL